MIDHIPELIESGVDSFKIEGRMKTALYAAVTARAYRRAIDDYLESPEKYAANLESYREEIGKCTYREYTTGFFFGKPNEEAQIYDSNTYVRNYTYLGKVASVDAEGYAHFEQKNKFSVGDRIERMCFDGSNELLTVLEIRNPEGISVESAPHPKEALAVRFDGSVAAGELLRMETLG
jgi:collagenase and related proteases